MSSFCSDQGRTRVCGEAYVCTPQPETRGERRAGQKGPFMDGHKLEKKRYMVDQKLMDNLNRLGFPLMEAQVEVDANKTLAEVVKSKDTRLWEGFAVLLANAARDYHFDYEQVQRHFTKKESLEDFKSLLLLSLALYQYYHLSFAWSNQFKKKLIAGRVSSHERIKTSFSPRE